MACLTREQLARLALGIDEDGSLSAHVEQCEACRAKLAEMGRLVEQLSAAHGQLDRGHAASRARLLANLSSVDAPVRRVGIWNRLTFRLAGQSMTQRIVVGGIGVAAAAGLVLLCLVWTSGEPVSAMERMAKQLREVKSYSYKTTEDVTIVQKGKTKPGTVKLSGVAYWRAPGSFRDEMKIVIGGAVPRGYHDGETTADFVEICPAGKPGILILHNTKAFDRFPAVRASDTGSGSLTYPLVFLRVIREETGKIERDLGTKEIEGKKAQGYLIAYKKFGEMEVWLDPETDLPLEFIRETKDATTTSILRISDCRWNTELDPTLFEPTPPEGYTDVTPPSDEKSIAQIAAALKLYAKLSGGHYPRVNPVIETFDADAIRDEMRKMAGFTGAPKPEWNHDKTFLEIQQAAVGLDCIAKILRGKGNTGYDGLQVGSKDKGKVLLWWGAEEKPSYYRVFYGDLRTELLPQAESDRFMHKLFEPAPEEDQKPSENR